MYDNWSVICEFIQKDERKEQTDELENPFPHTNPLHEKRAQGKVNPCLPMPMPLKDF